MKKNRSLYLVAVAVLAPLLWVALTLEFEERKHGWLLFVGAMVTASVLLRTLWKSQLEGKILAHRCGICDSPLRRIRAGELRPPSGHTDTKQASWRCDHCGQLI